MFLSVIFSILLLKCIFLKQIIKIIFLNIFILKFSDKDALHYLHILDIQSLMLY